MSTEEHAFTQQLISDIAEPFGAFVALGNTKVITLGPTPYFGVCRLTIRRDRMIPRPWLAAVYHAKVHQPSFAVTSNNTLWQLDAETELPLESGNYSSEFRPVSGGRFALKKSGRQTVGVDRAILLANRVSYSYFHLAFEQLTKLTILSAFPEYRDWPVIVDSRFPPSVRRMLNVAIGTSREIIRPASHVDIVARHLVLASTQAFLPDDPDLDLLAAVVNTNAAVDVVSRMELTERAGVSAKFVWITRREYARSAQSLDYVVRDIQNSEEINAVFASLGATVTSPEMLTFDEQRALFAQADVVGMAAGSAITNLLFCRPGTKVLVLSQDRHVNPALFVEIAQSLRLDLCWVFGPGIPSTQAPAHWSFMIDPLNVFRAVQYLRTDHRIPDGWIPFETIE